MSGRLTLSDPSVKELAQASCIHERYYDALPKLKGEANWQEWSDALQHAALMAAADTVLNGESKHPQLPGDQQCTTAEWNDNIKRIAIWRSRNESLLKAMRAAADIDFTDFRASNAYDTYISLRSRYCTSDNQRAFKLFSENLVVGYELDDSPKEIANQLLNAFHQYNQLVGNNIEQRLPENFLKMAFLGSLNRGYANWRKALLRERDVLALGQRSTMTFNELVDLVVVEQTQLLQQQKTMTAPKLASPSQRAPKRNVSQVDEAEQTNLDRPSSLPHHPSGNHTNQVWMVQNPRLRYLDQKPGKTDETRLTERPEIEDPQPRDISLEDFDNGSGDDSEDRSENGSQDYPDEESEHGSEHSSGNGSESMSMSESDIDSGSENKDEIERGATAGGRDDLSNGNSNNEENSGSLATADGVWERFVAARYTEVEAQRDLVARLKGGKKAPSVGDLSGKWLLYHKEHVSSTADHYHIELWETTSEKQKQLHPASHKYEGTLTIGPHGHSKTFTIPVINPQGRARGRPTPIAFIRSGESYGGRITFWGGGKTIVAIPPPVLGLPRRKAFWFEFAGLQSNPVATGTQANTSDLAQSYAHKHSVSAVRQSAGRRGHKVRVEAADDYDRIIRTDYSTNVAVKVENADSNALMDDDKQDSTSVVIKTE